MKLSQDYAAGSQVIQSFSSDHVRINEKDYAQSLLLGNQLLVEDWGITHIEQLTHSHWQHILEQQPEVVIMGTGPRLIFPSPASYSPVIERGIGVEFMDTGAACRTYNVLLSEDRAVIAGLILPA